MSNVTNADISSLETKENSAATSSSTTFATNNHAVAAENEELDESTTDQSNNPELLEKLKQVQQKIKLLTSKDEGRDELLQNYIKGYKEQISLFESLKQRKLFLATQFRELQMRNIEETYNSDVQQAKSDYENDISTYIEKLLNQALEEEKRISEELKGITPTRKEGSDSAQNEEDKKPGRKLTRNRRGAASNTEKWSNVINMSYETYSKKKRLPWSLEGMNFQLSTDEINQDLKKMKYN
ncbi:hypothetical protein FDP41_003209 [Naegleria fowleri]|uniref:Uncharacterized protein n=1 Tax=Naegleria fowleri TaxID=5763 RepID=A0A6A5BLJ0_NAEFO|nr:uncharacterized protein FDP41_003209 [Naegleria fowleri]KAF0977887.1 hypothetical protein FDP41_003209 [Naegleria fowleri]CAG4708018.1 unnamed protein product [Naegleria fowleri]